MADATAIAIVEFIRISWPQLDRPHGCCLNGWHIDDPDRHARLRTRRWSRYCFRVERFHQLDSFHRRGPIFVLIADICQTVEILRPFARSQYDNRFIPVRRYFSLLQTEIKRSLCNSGLFACFGSTASIIDHFVDCCANGDGEAAFAPSLVHWTCRLGHQLALCGGCLVFLVMSSPLV